MHEVSLCGQTREGVTDRQIRLGQKIMTRYESYRKADNELGDVIFRTQHHWLTIEMEMQVLRGILPRLNGKLQIHFSQMFQKLKAKLQEVVSLLDTIIGGSGSFVYLMRTMSWDRLSYKKGRLNRLKFATHVKGDVDKILVELGDWHGMLQLSWFLLSRVQDSAVDAQLSTHLGSSGNQQIEKLQELRNAIHGKSSYNTRAPQLFMEEQEWIGNRTPVLYSAGKIARDLRTMDLIYIETFTPHPKIPSNISAKNIRDLANILSTVDPMIFFILSCQGVIVRSESPGRIRSFELVFGVPKCLNNPQTLREVLLRGCRYPLGTYFRFARRLARAIMFVHSANFVHKNLRPDTILVFTHTEECNDIGEPFLVGFESFRPLDGCTYLVGDCEWQKNLYRHPTRQGLFPEDYYQMQHDIYSLGVCLLELGMGESFVMPDVVDTDFVPSSILPISEYLPLKPPRGSQRVKEHLITMAELRLPVLMGLRYTKVVVMCLSCLDGDNNDFGDQRELFDSDGILVGVRYIEKVCGTLLIYAA